MKNLNSRCAIPFFVQFSVVRQTQLFMFLKKENFAKLTRVY